MFLIWMISGWNMAYEEPKKATLIDIVHVTRIYTYHPFCHGVRILLREFMGGGPNYYDGECLPNSLFLLAPQVLLE